MIDEERVALLAVIEQQAKRLGELEEAQPAAGEGMSSADAIGYMSEHRDRGVSDGNERFRMRPDGIVEVRLDGGNWQVCNGLWCRFSRPGRHWVAIAQG